MTVWPLALVVGVIAITVVQVAAYYYLLRDGGSPVDGLATPADGDRAATPARRSDAEAREAYRRCGECGAPNETEGIYTFCRECGAEL